MASVEEGEPLILPAASPQPSYRSTESDEQHIDAEASILERSIAYFTETYSRSTLYRVVGVVLVMCAGFSFTSSNVMQKFTVRHVTFWQLLSNRAVIQATVMGGCCCTAHFFHLYLPADDGDVRREWSYMLLGPRGVRCRTVTQGLLGGGLLACVFVAVRLVPLGNASAIMFCTPIFTFVMAPCFLGGRAERLGVYRMVIILLMTLGVLFITRPDGIFGPSIPEPSETGSLVYDGLTVTLNSVQRDYPSSDAIYGYCCCVLVPFLSALISLITRQCNLAQVPIYILMFWFGMGAIIVCTLVSIRQGSVISIFFGGDTRTFMLMTCVTTLGIFGNMCYTIAVKYVSPSVANVFRSFEVILNFALQVHLEKMPYHDINFVGIALLLMAVLVMSYENRAHARWRQRIKYL